MPFYLMMNKKLVRNELIFLFNFNKHQIKRKKRDCFQSTWQRPWRHCNVLVTGLRPSDSSCSCCFYHQSVEILFFDNFFAKLQLWRRHRFADEALEQDSRVTLMKKLQTRVLSQLQTLAGNGFFWIDISLAGKVKVGKSWFWHF